MTLAEITRLFQQAQAAANLVPVVGLNPYAQLGFMAGNAILGIVGQLDQNATVPRPESIAESDWIALSAFAKTGSQYIAEAQASNPFDPSKVRQPTSP